MKKQNTFNNYNIYLTNLSNFLIFIIFLCIFFYIIKILNIGNLLYLDTPKTQKVYSIYYKTEIEIPISEKINIHNSDLPTFLKYKITKYYGIFKEYFDYYYIIIKNYIINLPYFNEIYSAFSAVFYFCYSYFYIILKKVSIFLFSKALILHNFIISIYEKIKAEIPPMGVYTQVTPAHKQGRTFYPEFVHLRFIVSKTYGFDIFNTPYCPKQHYITVFGYTFELKINGVSIYFFDWVDNKRFSNWVTGIHYLKFYINYHKKSLACSLFYYLVLGMVECFEDYANNESKLNIFKLFVNGNFLYGCLGYFFYFTIHAIFLEIFFSFADRVVITIEYWVWRLIAIFGSKDAKHKAKIVIRGYDIVELEEEAKKSIIEFSQEIFDTFKALETFYYHKAKVDPEEVILTARFFDVEYRYRTIEIFIDVLHLLAEELDPNRKASFTEENLELADENKDNQELLEALYTHFKQRSKSYDKAAMNSLNSKIIRERRKKRDFLAFTAENYFKPHNITKPFGKEHIEILAQIYKEQLLKEFEEEKYKNIKKKEIKQ